MIHLFCKRLQLILSVALLCGIATGALGEELIQTGTLHVSLTSVQVGVGWTWGEGTLTLHDGTEYHFKISGLDVVAVGFKQATMVGSVYNLKTSKIEDFSGKYIKAKAAITVGGGVGASSLRNDKGVVINLTGTAAGINVQLSVSGMTVKLQES